MDIFLLSFIKKELNLPLLNRAVFHVVLWLFRFPSFKILLQLHISSYHPFFHNYYLPWCFYLTTDLLNFFICSIVLFHLLSFMSVSGAEPAVHTKISLPSPKCWLPYLQYSKVFITFCLSGQLLCSPHC